MLYLATSEAKVEALQEVSTTVPVLALAGTRNGKLAKTKTTARHTTSKSVLYTLRKHHASIKN